VATLETSRFFRQINAADLATLTKVAPELQFAPGQEIFKEGDRGDGVYVVKSGLVEITALVAENVRHVFSKVGPGDIFG
jgi:CRP-like cAMP-binding protein